MSSPRGAVGVGMVYALAAGMAWGLVFVVPVLLPDYPVAMLAFGRYLAFGLVALPLAWHDRAALARLSRADWREALALAAVGNVLYYLCLAGAIRAAGVPLPTIIIGALPVVIAVCANLSARETAWRRLLPSLALVGAGVACVNAAEWRAAMPAPGSGTHLATSTTAGASALPAAGEHLATGTLLALGALACWTWYPLRNARWLRRRSDVAPGAWATAQGLATLPLAAAGMAATLGWLAAQPTGAAGFDWPLGARPARYLGLMLALGLLASWLGTLCWNRASRLLPGTLAGQTIVFETLAALLYGFVHRQAWPDALTWAGITLLVAGVGRSTRSAQAQAG